MWAVELKNLHFAYEAKRGEKSAPVFEGIDLRVPAGARVLLIGANGVGKSTLLQLLAGRHLLDDQSLSVFGKPPFHDMTVSSRIGLVDGDFPLTVDLGVSELLAHPTPGVDTNSQKKLLELLEIDPSWRMCRVSDGQRRRVQLLLALRRPFELLLLDEVTSHLDIVARSDLLGWLRETNEKAGATLIYTTHILDGLWNSTGGWPTHIAFLRKRKPVFFKPVEEIAELKKEATLSQLAERWIRSGVD